MKKIVLLLLPALAFPTAVEANWFGKYNSRYDANEACEIWMMKGFKYTYKVLGKKGYSDIEPIEPPKYIDGSGDIQVYRYVDPEAGDKYWEDKWAAYEESESIVEKTRSGFSRSCLEEKETNQFIGRAKSCLKKKDYSVEEWEKLFELKSCEKRKYFKY